MPCNETAHALIFKVKIGSKSAIIIGHQAKNHTVANSYNSLVQLMSLLEGSQSSCTECITTGRQCSINFTESATLISTKESSSKENFATIGASYHGPQTMPITNNTFIMPIQCLQAALQIFPFFSILHAFSVLFSILSFIIYIL